MRLRADDVFTTAVDGQTVVLDARTSVYLTTNAVGTRILEILERDRSLDQIADVVAAEFDVTAEVARHDCLAFIDQLAEQGLLEDGH